MPTAFAFWNSTVRLFINTYWVLVCVVLVGECASKCERSAILLSNMSHVVYTFIPITILFCWRQKLISTTKQTNNWIRHRHRHFIHVVYNVRNTEKKNMKCIGLPFLYAAHLIWSLITSIIFFMFGFCSFSLKISVYLWLFLWVCVCARPTIVRISNGLSI